MNSTTSPQLTKRQTQFLMVPTQSIGSMSKKNQELLKSLQSPSLPLFTTQKRMSVQGFINSPLPMDQINHQSLDLSTASNRFSVLMSSRSRDKNLNISNFGSISKIPSFLKQSSRTINSTQILGSQERSSSKQLIQSPRKNYERSGSKTTRKQNNHQGKIVIDVVLRNKVNTTPIVQVNTSRNKQILAKCTAPLSSPLKVSMCKLQQKDISDVSFQPNRNKENPTQKESILLKTAKKGLNQNEKIPANMDL